MPRNRLKKSNSALAIAALCLALAGTAHSQFSGRFGSKMEAYLTRKNPPQVYLLGTAIKVQARSQVRTRADYAAQLASTLETELISQDRRLRPQQHNPETIISCEITRVDSDEKWEERRSKETKKTGERQVWNDKKQKYETKAVYEEVEVVRNFKVISAAINVSYQAQDTRTGSILDSDTFPLSYIQAYLDGVGAPAQQEYEHRLVQSVASLIVPRLVPTTEKIKVLLAQGKIKDISKFGEAGLWQKMIEALESMEPLKNPKDDSYRLYNIGVGYEALAYKAEDMSTTKKLLDKAAVLYGQAYEAKPGEKYFKEPQVRIEQAIAKYRKIEEQQKTYTNAIAIKEQEESQKRAIANQRALADSKSIDKQPQSNTLKPFNNQAPAKGPMSNQRVIDLVQQGLDEANLIATIKEAANVQFDLSSEALSDLLKNKVSNKIISAMRARQAGKQTPARPVSKRRS